MPTFRHGKNIKVFFGAYELTPFLRSISIPMSADTADTTCFAAPVKTYVIGIPSASANAEGIFSYDNVAPNADIENVLSAAYGQEAPTLLAVGFDGSLAAGKSVYVGESHLSNYNIAGSVSDLVALNSDWQITDFCNPGISLNNADVNTAVTASPVVGTGQDYAALCEEPGFTTMTRGGVAGIHLVTNTATGAGTTIKVQHSNLIGGTYVDLATLTVAASTIGTVDVVIPRGTTVNRFIRFNITATGTGNLRFLAYFAPRRV